jgi:tetratricopeptide (TPR) repeat protein
VVEAARRFASVSVNTDERQDLIERYRTNDIPNVFFFNPDGHAVMKLEYPDMDTPEKLVAGMARAEEAAKRFAEQEDALLTATELNANDGKAFASLGDFYNRAYSYALAAQAYRDAAGLLPESDMATIESIRLEIVFMELKQNRLDACLAEADRFEKQFPKSAKKDSLQLYRGYAHFYAKRYDEASAILEKLRKEFPDSPNAAAGKKVLDAIRVERSKK